MQRRASATLAATGQRLRGQRSLLAGVIVAVAVGALPVLVVPRLAARQDLPVQLNAEAGSTEGIAAFLADLQRMIEPLQEEVDAGRIVPKFGERASSILEELRETTGAGVELERAADAALRTLFLRQLILLRQQSTAKFEKATSGRTEDAVVQADKDFVTRAEDLKRPGWSYDAERYSLRAALESSLRGEAALEEEMAMAAQTQQSTVEIIAKLQSQMEAMQQRVQAMRAGSPWFLSASYRIPRTPFQLIGRYQQGRANMELSLNPDKDPANSEAGFVEGFGPMNLGVNLNLGM